MTLLTSKAYQEWLNLPQIETEQVDPSDIDHMAYRCVHELDLHQEGEHFVPKRDRTKLRKWLDKYCPDWKEHYYTKVGFPVPRP